MGRRSPIGAVTLALLALSGAAARPAEAPLATGETIEVAPGERLGLDELGAGETVLLLPSLAFPGYGVRHVVPRLVDSGHRVLVVDPLGLGSSTQPPSADYSSGAHAREKESLGEQLPRVRSPVRLLSGATPHPGGVPEDELRRMRAGLAHLELESAPRCGHFVAVEAPDAVVQAIDALAAAESGALAWNERLGRRQ